MVRDIEAYPTVEEAEGEETVQEKCPDCGHLLIKSQDPNTGKWLLVCATCMEPKREVEQ